MPGVMNRGKMGREGGQVPRTKRIKIDPEKDPVNPRDGLKKMAR